MQSCTELILQEHGCTTTSPSKSDFVSWTLIAVLFSNQIDVCLFGLALDIVHIVFNCGSILLLNPMLSAERRRFFRHSHSYWETYDLSVYYFSLLVELDAAPCSARYDERCKEPCHVPAASWIWLSQACFSLRRFWRMERSVFYDPCMATQEPYTDEIMLDRRPKMQLFKPRGTKDQDGDSELCLVQEACRWLRTGLGWRRLRKNAWFSFVLSWLWSTCEFWVGGGHACVHLCSWWTQLAFSGTDAFLGKKC